MTTAKERYDEAEGGAEPDPLERLRFFCSLAMNGDDWLDVEPLFDAVVHEIERLHKFEDHVEMVVVPWLTDLDDPDLTPTMRVHRAVDAMKRQANKQSDALRLLEQWAGAYPLTVFPEPDLKRAHELLTAGGMTLDAVSASNMRHVLDGVRKIVSNALARDPG